MIKIGVISDTHGLLREEVIEALRECGMILHAGDINKPEIIEALEQIAPVKVVRGNNDKGEWAEKLPDFLDFQIEGYRFYMTHQKKDVPKDLAGVDMVIMGHSHRYSDTIDKKVRFLNPGSCGKRRFDQPITMAKLMIDEGQLAVEMITIPYEPAKR